MTTRKKDTGIVEASPLSFEQSLNELQAIVEALETNQLPLQTALEKFEQGVRLTAQCEKSLKEAEQKVQILLKQGETETLAPFEA